MLGSSDESMDQEFETSSLYTLRALRKPIGARILAHLLLTLLIIFLVVLFLPWQQNIRGYGRVTALNPENRPQTVETIIPGRIKQWYVNEGDYVKRGDTIAAISEVKEKYFDPALLTRLQQQLTGKENSAQAKGEKIEALQRQASALHKNMALKLEQGEAKLQAARIRYDNATNQFERNKRLYEAGNIPLTKFQDFEYKYQDSRAEFLTAELELRSIEASYLEKINKVESDLNHTLAEVYDTEVAIAKLRNEYTNMEIRNNQYNVLAPQAGYIVHAKKSGIGETLKAGDAICTIMPKSGDMAVEMYVKGMDVPLISKDRKVRISFDGWPALQFSGWPSVSVGTFGGIVKVIDYTNSQPGKFRILVVPDTTDEAWPTQLRMGSGTKGWVMLENVPIWYELWRNLNGFPPSLYEAPATDTSTEKK